jgi:hypothetical protein
MEKQLEPQESLHEIRQMMERSSRFISLNGLSGVFAGILALLGAYVAFQYLQTHYSNENDFMQNNNAGSYSGYLFFAADAALVLFGSIGIAIILSYRKAKEKGVDLWDKTAQRVFINLMIPLSAGGIFCIILLFHGLIGMVAPATLIFYGLALINASKYTFNDIRYLGMVELVIGLMAAIFIGYGLFFWAAGFGLAHIVYGAVMYFKYDR